MGARGRRLTPGFFTSLHATLARAGRLTIFSDNGRYCRTLAAMLGVLRGPGGRKLYASQRLATPDGDALEQEMIEGVALYHGVPGEAAGHLRNESSAFDRLFENREQTDRFYMLLERVDEP